MEFSTIGTAGGWVLFNRDDHEEKLMDMPTDDSESAWKPTQNDKTIKGETENRNSDVA